ncbi:hypothetical protein [Rosistilla oblonga]|uniref:hypothetical protein n=1 Tax=Rosistilla oblonga TaxID=2527990 RepID=UPI003A97E21C
MLPTPHHHIVFTVPHSLNELWRFNKVQFSKLLFDAAFETLHELLADPKYLGAVPGILAAHTWNRADVRASACVGHRRRFRAQQWSNRKGSACAQKVLMIKFRGSSGRFSARGSPRDCCGYCRLSPPGS